MKITPLEIRQKEFEKSFRGYDKDEVEAFLLSLSQEWERVIDDSKEMRIKLETTLKEVEKLREVESSLFKTLKTAEDTGANMIDQANKTAELHLKETQMKAEALMSDVKSRAKTMLEEAENKAKSILTDTEEEIKELAQSVKDLENYRDNLIADLKRLSGDVADKVQRADKHFKRVDIDTKLNTLKQPVDSGPVPVAQEQPQNDLPESVEEEKTEEKSSGSFFDEIE